MEPTTLTIGDDDAALVLRADGMQLRIPQRVVQNPDDEAPHHVAMTMAFAIIYQHPVLSAIVLRMAEGAADSEAAARGEEAAA